QLDADAVLRRPHAGDPAAQLEADRAPAEGALEQLGGGLVLQRDQVRQRLDDRDVDAEGGPRAGELAADDAAAQHDRRRRHAVQPQRVVAGDDLGGVDLDAGQRARVGAGGQQHGPALVGPAAGLHRRRGDQPALALDVGDAAALDQPLQALVETADDAVLVGVDAVHVDAGQRRLDAELLALARLVGDLTAVQERLGGDAAAVQSGATDLVLLDEDDVEPELARA